MGSKEILWGVVLGIFGIAVGGALMVVFAQHPEWANAILYGCIAICGLCVLAGIVLAGLGVRGEASSGFRLRRVKDWSLYDQTGAFRLGQWAALIDGYDYHPDPKDDPGYRPWRHKFFRLKRAVENGSFGIAERKADRGLLVSREAMRAFYEKAGERPAALFPEDRSGSGHRG
jgi:hypothetical protein